ncbi:MAG: hypothetical protein L0Z54_05620 [Thermoplasmata archaeon]|nr:hypothetical protein [Thermoplasmata archaeon]
MTATCREVTFDVLLNALRRTMGTEISEEALKRIAEYVLNIFGYGSYYPDYRLNQEERNLFYLLEDHGFVTTHEEKLAFPRGGTVRIGFWILKKRFILEVVGREEDCRPGIAATSEPPASVYDTLDQDAWARNGAAGGSVL